MLIESSEQAHDNGLLCLLCSSCSYCVNKLCSICLNESKLFSSYMKAGMVYDKKRQRDSSETDQFVSTKGRVQMIRRIDALTVPRRGINALMFVPKLDTAQPPSKSLAASVISILEDVWDKVWAT